MAKRIAAAFFYLIGSCCIALTLPAQEEVEVVEEVEIVFKGARNVSDEAIMVHIQIREGMRYDQNLVDRSVRSLYRTGLFETVEAQHEEISETEVKVIFEVLSKYRVSQVIIRGVKKARARRLHEKLETVRNGVLDEKRVKNDRDELFEDYRDKGYLNADVDYKIEYDIPDPGYGRVTYIIDEGSRRKIRVVQFEGNNGVKSKLLRKEMKTKKHNFISWLTGGSKFKEITFQEDLDKLRRFYKNEGYLDITIEEADISLEFPKKKAIEIHIKLTEGRRYQVGDISISGNALFTERDLLSVMGLRSGDVFSPEKLDEGREGLADFYGLIGYLDTFIRAERTPNLETGDIDIHFNVDEGERVYVESINIEGNTKTKSIVILRELALAPGQVFNLVRMKNSEARLKNTRFFEDVNLSPESTNIPGRRNLKIAVREGRTGQFQFGAGFGSVRGGMFFTEFSQSNFDLFNWRSVFQGDGQKFRLRFSVGSRSSSVIMAYEEPWLFEQRLSLGVTVFRSETEYDSSIYDERRTGFEVALRKRLFRLWDGTVAYRLERAELFNIMPDAPDFIKETGNFISSKITFAFLRDTRNNIIYTTRGNRFVFTTQYAGIGGDVDYVLLETRYAHFIPTFKFGNQSIAILGRMGTIFETGDSPVPFVDRFYLGGPESLRGFEFRDVGPKEDRYREPMGGNSYGFASVEYTYEVAEALRLAVFYDWGFINNATANFNTSRANSNFGFGVRIMMMNNPMRLDLGIPLTSDEFNDKGKQFNFAFGSRF